MKRSAGFLTLLGASLLAMPMTVAAQSIASGALAGRVVNESGVPIFDADVALQSVDSDAVAIRITDRSGAFSFGFLTPGDYSLRVEAVGYRPLHVMRIPVRPGGSLPVVATLREEAPPVTGVDSLALPGAASERVRPGEGRWLGGLELDRLPDGERRIENLLGLTSLAGSGSGLEGLPASMLALYIDGLRVPRLTLPGMHRDPLFGALAPRVGLSGVEVIRGNGETEWNSAGGVASLITRAPGGRFAVEGYADYTGGSLWSSTSIDSTVPEHQSLRGGAIVDLPIVPDTVHATFGVEVLRTERPRAALFAAADIPGWVSQAGALAGILDVPTVEMRDLVSAFGRIDWNLGSDARVSVRANLASLGDTNGEPDGYPLVPGQTPLAAGRDLSAGVTVQVPLDDGTQIEVKAGLVSSNRTYGSGQGFPYTRIPELPVAIGTYPAIPGDLSSTVFELIPTSTFEVGDHRLKVGIGITASSYDITQASGANGDVALGGAQGTGLYSVTGGQSLRSNFSTISYSIFGQDVWNAAPGVHLLFGARIDVDQVPDSDIQVSPLYDSLFVGRQAAVRRSDTISDVRSFGTRFSFVWDVAEQNRTFVRGGGSLSYDPLDPMLYHEWILGDDRRTVATNVDSGTWPNLPSTGAGRPWLTIGGDSTSTADVRRARTTRAHFGLTRSMGGGLAFHVGTAFRRTEGMVRRFDANLTPQPSGVDQFGRPIYGLPLQRGSAVVPSPTQNRRFPGLAQVDFLIVDGWSQYQDVSIGLEKRGEGPLQLFANYTFSSTKDNMVGWANPDVNERRVPVLDPTGNDSWSEDVSDFDVPHRFVAGLTYDVPAVSGLQVSGVYRYSSAAPFTPGFRPGVDANGDGAFSNDPAYVGSIDLNGVGSEWSCVRSVPSGPIARNSCRGGAVMSLDLRVSLGLVRIGSQELELVFDALNVIEPDIGIRDGALYLVDPAGSIGRSGNTFNMPLMANPNFGNLAVLQTPGRILRVGLKVVH